MENLNARWEFNLPHSVESERKIMDSNLTRGSELNGTFPHANNGAESMVLSKMKEMYENVNLNAIRNNISLSPTEVECEKDSLIKFLFHTLVPHSWQTECYYTLTLMFAVFVTEVTMRPGLQCKKDGGGIRTF